MMNPCDKGKTRKKKKMGKGIKERKIEGESSEVLSVANSFFLSSRTWDKISPLPCLPYKLKKLNQIQSNNFPCSI